MRRGNQERIRRGQAHILLFPLVGRTRPISAFSALQMAARAGLNKNNSGVFACPSVELEHGPIDPGVAVKRIMQEARELANDPCTDYAAAPLEVSLSSITSDSISLTPLLLSQDDIFVSTKIPRPANREPDCW